MLTIRDLSKTYANGVRALSGVSLDVPTGMFGLLGPNGAGKSTLMRTIATLQEPDAGSIRFDGVDVLRDKQAVRRLLGYLPQEFGVYPKLTAAAMLEHFAVLKGLARARERRAVVRALLERTNLWEVRDRKLGTFSGGMRQRFGIAQALLGEPRLVIVDEPTAGLDPEERGRFLNLLAEIGENVVVILSTHIVDDVADLCTRMAVISQGEVRLTGEPRREVAALAGLIWKKAVAKGDLERHRRELEVLSMRLVAGRPEIHVFSREHPGDGFAPVEPSLEDVYFHALRSAPPAAAAAA
jgi:ABC-type multidrug transport system ATPase subunit